MKRAISYLLTFFCAGLVLNAPLLFAAGNGGHLIVERIANFGTDLSLVLSIDGTEVARVGDGRKYDGHLPAGQHVISANVVPNRDAANPWRTTLQVKDGETYSFTARWRGEDLILSRN